MFYFWITYKDWIQNIFDDHLLKAFLTLLLSIYSHQGWLQPHWSQRNRQCIIMHFFGALHCCTLKCFFISLEISGLPCCLAMLHTILQHTWILFIIYNGRNKKGIFHAWIGRGPHTNDTFDLIFFAAAVLSKVVGRTAPPGHQSNQSGIPGAEACMLHCQRSSLSGKNKGV